MWSPPSRATPVYCWLLTAHICRVPRLCEALDVNHRWSPQCAVLTWPPHFPMRRQTLYILLQSHRTLGFKVRAADSAFSPPSLQSSVQHSSRFESHFQGESWNLRFCAACFHSKCHTFENPEWTGNTQGQPHHVATQWIEPLCFACSWATGLSVTASQESPSAGNALPCLSTSSTQWPRSQSS